MKKILILALSLIFVLSMSVFVFADDGGQGSVRSMVPGTKVLIGGDARVRGVWQNNYNMDDDTDADDRWWDQRVRLKVTGNVGSGIEVRTRLETNNDRWDGTANTTTNNDVEVDYAYLHIPMQGLVIDAGAMKRYWGNKLLRWDIDRDTFEITTNVAATQVGLFTEKIDDTGATAGAENLEDYNNYGVFANHSAGNMKAGLLLIYEDNNVDATTTSGGDETGTEVSGYLNTSVGAIGIAAELAYKGGDLNEDAAGNNATAGFVYAETDLGAISVNGFVSVLNNGFVADTHLTPTVFFGTDNPTAIADVQAASDSTTWAAVVGAGTDVSQDLSVSAKLGYFDLENLGAELGGADSGDESVTELDLGLAYKIAANCTYSLDFGYMMPDSVTTTDDNAMALAHKVEVAF